ncbi:sensor histidine kinase [Candidatus Nitrosotalea okcheonensis]|uniref:histidine kinase n=1 Tax=Candidatus Nitrosotalea okcheonensis TaxID=1903276 RepID=A0A2H1FFC1_9ARCH|nr:HAMP domain-containing sensor histidine kinase [Candidatus Nitrosotalea okcheonensis]SMH71456.1 putative Histidine kinase [Candidatus Nitrosotalea okcheonensis]
MTDTSDETNRATLHAIQVKNIQKHIREQVEKVKGDAFAAREETVHKRAEKIEQVREKLNQTTLDIQHKHEMIRERLNQEAVFREANIRVSRGLEALEKFIQVLRDTQMEDEMLKKAIRDPIISGSLKSDAMKIITSEFFRSIQKQLVMQTEFINIAAHELRTPIMPILVNIELLEDQLGKDNPEIKIIARNARRLQRLTENILSVARLESKSFTLKTEVFNLNDIILAVIKDESVQLSNDNIDIAYETDTKNIQVDADKDRIAQVIYNLLHNAIKFTDMGKIVITSKHAKDCVEVSVSDNGKGIDPKIIPILFSKFVTKSDKGTGLGLYICKGIIEAHGGKIWAEPMLEKRQGAKFCFSLPMRSNIDSPDHSMTR